MEVQHSMKRFKGLLPIAALALVSGAALAQDSQGRFDPTPYNFSFRLGLVLPSTDPLRAMENNWLGFGMDYTFPKQFFKGSETSVSADYIAKSFSGEHGSFWPIMVNQKFFSGDFGEEGRTYFLAGIGVVMFDVSTSDTVFGGKIGAGVEFSKQLFLEGDYYISDASKGNIRAQSLGLWFGYRF